MLPLYAWPLTVSGPLIPFSKIRARWAFEPRTHSEAASGGMLPAWPWPVAWWQLTHAWAV